MQNAVRGINFKLLLLLLLLGRWRLPLDYYFGWIFDEVVVIIIYFYFLVYECSIQIIYLKKTLSIIYYKMLFPETYLLNKHIN